MLTMNPGVIELGVSGFYACPMSANDGAAARASFQDMVHTPLKPPLAIGESIDEQTAREQNRDSESAVMDTLSKDKRSQVMARIA